ncbi:MAG: peptidylprolyl isomerase [Myxococcales bacterium]|nr:peptidylprolyl isomerase [Polyangiaceae bacterium]MDW8250075.1 peptidylprolyl isomerase [Myxococcales bacterium]
MRTSVLAVLLLSSCSSPATMAPGPSGGVPQGAVAICADRAIQGSSVAPVAMVARVSAKEALQRLAHDIRLAAEAENRGLHKTPAVQRELKAALVRAVLTQIKEQHAAPPTLSEIQILRAERWRDFDRPESARVIHAVAMGGGSEAARKVAEAIRKETTGAKNETEFEVQAKKVPHEGVEVRVERLPAMARDGRNVEEEGSFATPFAEAALSLTQPGEQSPVVATSFGYHVIFLIERVPAYRPADEELARIAHDEILTRRMSSATRSLVEQLRREYPVTLERNAIELIDLLERRKGR